MSQLRQFVKRFGFFRGIVFYRVAQACERDPGLLKNYAASYRAKASNAFYHEDRETGRALLGFAEILDTSYHNIVLKKKPQRPLLAAQMHKNKKAVKRIVARHSHGRFAR